MGPHLMLLDGFHHGGAKKIALETWIEERHQKTGHSQGHEDRASSQCVWKRIVKDLREGVTVKRNDTAGPRAPAHINTVMRASEQLIQRIS